MTDRDEVARALSAHLGGLATWGIDFVLGEPAPPAIASAPGGIHPVAEGTAEMASPVDAATELATIAREVAACTSCTLCRSRTNTVPGVGDPGGPGSTWTCPARSVPARSPTRSAR